MEVTSSFYYTGAEAPKRAPLRQFAPLLVAMVGLPGRGKSLMAKRLARYLNFTGDVCKGKLFIIVYDPILIKRVMKA